MQRLNSMLDHISSSHLVRTCTWVVYGNCSTNGVTQSGNYVKYRFVVKVKICTFIMFSIQMSSYSSKHTRTFYTQQNMHHSYYAPSSITQTFSDHILLLSSCHWQTIWITCVSQSVIPNSCQ